ncbi:hypothetical protein BD779DRAFT_1666310 [Infundibulicybe gibba]|nr:hypothetical protein BD779DRAFT_1666310 [Infundibulicybe gibba]
MAESSTNRPLSFYRLYVKKICLHRVPRNAAAKILSYCHPNASLAYWSTPDHSDTTGNDLATLLNSGTFQPSRLSTYISHLFKGTTLNFRLPFFQNITHLDVTDSHFSSYWGVFEQAGFRQLPRLTHLALEFRDYLGQSEIDLALATSPPTLKVCLLWMDGVERIKNWGLEDVATGHLDPRLVFYTPRDESGHDFNGNVLFVSYEEFFQQWGYTPQGMADFWEIAEEVVNKRLAKQVAQRG